MRRAQYLRRRLRALNSLNEAVGAMRSLSAHHFRQARKALPAGRTYRAEVEQILAEVGTHQAASASAPTGLLVVASDLGLCGDYNAVLSRFALDEIRRHQVELVYCVGRRVRSALVRASIVPHRQYGAPASLEGLSRLLLQLAQHVLQDYTAAEVGDLHVVSAQFDGVGHFTPLSIRVLPIQPVAPAKPTRRSPYVAPGHLAAVAVREYLYITLHQILLDALAAEHGMRLMAAENALQWLDNTTEQTRRALTATRGEAATQELLDLIAGGAQKRRGTRIV